ETFANDAISNIAPARAVVVALHIERGEHSRLEVIRAHVLLDLQLDAIPSRPQVRRTESTDNLERSGRQCGRPVAIDMHVAREEWPTIAANCHHEHRLR